MATKKKTTKKTAAKKTTSKKRTTTKKTIKASSEIVSDECPEVEQDAVELQTELQAETQQVEVVQEQRTEDHAFWAKEAAKHAASCPNHLVIKLSKQLKSRLKQTADSEGVGVEDLVEELLAESVVLRAWEIMQRKGAMRGDGGNAGFSGNKVQGGNNYRPQQNQRQNNRQNHRGNRNTHSNRNKQQGGGGNGNGGRFYNR